MNEILNDTFNTVNEIVVENSLDLTNTFNKIYLLLQVLLLIIVVIFLFNYLKITFKKGQFYVKEICLYFIFYIVFFNFI